MINYFPIHINNLEIIRNKILKAIAPYISIHKATKNSILFYIPSNKILDIDELKNQLIQLKLLEYIHGVAINITYNQGLTNIHKDAGGRFIYSLNIPISGYTNTYLNYFKSSADPVLYSTPLNQYIMYEKEHCTLIERHETILPAIVNTQAPHAFENSNDEPRILIALRLNTKVDSSTWLS